MSLASDLFNRFATDSSKEENGIWRDAGRNLELLIGRVGNRNYQRLLAKAVEDNKAALDAKGPQAEKLAEGISQRVLGEACLLGWRIKDGDKYLPVTYKGAELPYNAANVTLLMEMRDFRETVARLASEAQVYKMVQEEADEKNS